MKECSEAAIGEFSVDWIYVVSGYSKLHIYRSYSPQDIERAFAHDVANCDIEITAYCDGSGTKGDSPAGIGAVIYRPWAQPELIAQNIHLGTNNRAELCAVWAALRAVPCVDQKILVKTDSEYTIGALTKDWIRNANIDLIGNIRLDLAERPGVRFEHVDGHSGAEGNEIADRLANIGRKLITTVSPYEG